MAIYKNREIKVLFNLPTTHDEFVEANYPNGDKEHVRLSEVKFTKDELSTLDKQYKLKLSEYNSISDKELSDLRDSNNPEKIEKALKTK